MQKLLTILIVVLALAVAVVLVASVYGSYFLLTSVHQNLSFADRLFLLPVIAVSAGVLIAILTFVRERRRQEIERQRHRSEVLLAGVKKGFDTVITLLSDQNNNRITWVRAARTLMKALDLEKEILSEEYRVAYALEEERARNELYNVLTIINDESGERVPLPPQFFYGIEGWKECTSLDEAAIEASSHVTVYSPSIDKVPPQPHLKPIAPESIVAIFDFVEYPKDYDDPLRKVQVWEEDWVRSHGIDQGARRYVAHKRQKTAIGGKLIDRENKPD